MVGVCDEEFRELERRFLRALDDDKSVRLMAHADEVVKGVAEVEAQLSTLTQQPSALELNSQLNFRAPQSNLRAPQSNQSTLLLPLQQAQGRVSQARVELAASVVKLTTLWDQFVVRRERTAAAVAVLLQQQQNNDKDNNINGSNSNSSSSSNKEKDGTIDRLQLLEGKVRVMLASMDLELGQMEGEVGVGEEGLTDVLEELEGVLREVEGVLTLADGEAVASPDGVEGKGGAASRSISRTQLTVDVDDVGGGSGGSIVGGGISGRDDKGHEEQKQQRSTSATSTNIIAPSNSTTIIQEPKQLPNGQSKSNPRLNGQSSTQSNLKLNDLSIPPSPAHSPTHYMPPASPSVASPSLTHTTERSNFTHSTHHQLKREKKAQKLALKNAKKKAEKMKFVYSKRLNRVLGGIIPPGGKESKEDSSGIGAYRVNFDRSQVITLPNSYMSTHHIPTLFSYCLPSHSFHLIYYNQIHR